MAHELYNQLAIDLCSIVVVICQHIYMNSVTYRVAMIGGFLFL